MRHPTDRLHAYADGELPPEESRRLEEHLRDCTECAREVMLIRYLGGAMKSIQPGRSRPRIWERVHRRITRPAGWLLLAGGLAAWLGLAAFRWFQAGELTLEWLATTAIVVGLALLAIAVGYEQYRDWKETPYKDVEQ